jgi:hypothetical protein
VVRGCSITFGELGNPMGASRLHVAVPESLDSLVWSIGRYMHDIGREDALMIIRLLHAVATSSLPYQTNECDNRKSQANADHNIVLPRPSRPMPKIPKAGHTHRQVIDYLDDDHEYVYTFVDTQTDIYRVE